MKAIIVFAIMFIACCQSSYSSPKFINKPSRLVLSDSILSVNYDSLAIEAFRLSEQDYIPIQIDPCEILDYPAMDFIKCNSLTIRNVFDNDDVNNMKYYGVARPRCAQDRDSFEIYLDLDNDGSYNLASYDQSLIDWESAGVIGDSIPNFCRMLTRFVVGRKEQNNDEDGSWPQFFDIGGSGYIRFNGFFPQTVGSSYRVATHNVFSKFLSEDTTKLEDFPKLTKVFYNAESFQKSILLGLVEGEGFTGALKYDLYPGEISKMEVTAKFFIRDTIHIEKEPYTGLVAYSSMFLRDETTADSTNKEAHDLDWLIVGVDTNNDNVIDRIYEDSLSIPSASGYDIDITDYSEILMANSINGRQIYFALENRDDDSTHYILPEITNYHLRDSYSILVKESNIAEKTFVLFEQGTDTEANDNIVINLQIKEDLPKSETLNDPVWIKYTTYAYKPVDTDEDGLTDHLEMLVGTRIDNTDSDDDGITDYQELKDGTDPLVNVSERDKRPFRYMLNQNYPNPFNPSTTITFSISRPEHVRVEIYNLNGQRVTTLVDRLLPPGQYKESWDGTDKFSRIVANGLYIYKMSTPSFSSYKKMIFLK